MAKIHERFQISFDKILVIIYSGTEMARLSLGLCSWALDLHSDQFRQVFQVPQELQVNP